MATKAGDALVRVVFGGDAYLNARTARELCDEALKTRPDADLIEIDAASADRYAFDEAVSPSLLADTAVVRVDNLQSADERLGEAILAYLKESADDPNASRVICRHEGGQKGKRLIDQLVRAGAVKDEVPDLKKPEAKLNFVMSRFERLGRRVEPLAAQQLVDVLGDRTGELDAMCGQLCFDFDDDPIGLDRVNQYLTDNPQVTGFAVADAALAGRTADAIVMMRSAVEQGTAPIALIGALAAKLRTVAKASAVKTGAISAAEAGMPGWMLQKVRLGGWTSQGLATCIRMLAWADEQSKTSGGDPMYALERSIETIATKGR
ncbi:DNA polymerase III subunit delta [Bifidobacterium sp. UTCIF-37]|uniref:DNA polymerase III subunit delta n=1 Tax=unclassified Bifidobacterium TaxID=2608897 RepID=UPI0015E486F3|nr:MULTISPECIES: DNA polymerase III subunit delta [unclassified Bifidobacterium]TPF87517.1 DNA polymerase III subunit delta [Bifidobacterium sp. UTCIF-37]TPF91543.1 DNA polymerase III subunit delta [Bifidobacterium sp. UTCIF-38]